MFFIYSCLGIQLFGTLSKFSSPDSQAMLCIPIPGGQLKGKGLNQGTVLIWFIRNMNFLQNDHRPLKLCCSVYSKGGNFIYPMMHRFILYYQASEGTWSLVQQERDVNNGGKRLVLPIKLSVPLLCRSILVLLFQIYLLLSQRECVLAADYELTSLTIARQSTQMFLEASKEGLCFSTSCFNVHW